MRVVLVTGHTPHQQRKPSMLWLSEAFQSIGCHVTLCSTGFSWLSRLKADPRLAEAGPLPRHARISSTLDWVSGMAPIHPVTFRHPALTASLRPFMALSERYWAKCLAPAFRQADVIVLESGPPILLAKLAKRFGARAQIIYRVNDDIRLLNAPPWMVRQEQRNVAFCDRISAAAPAMLDRFEHPNKTRDPMGIPPGLIAPQRRNGRGAARIQAVCAGSSHMDLARCIGWARDCPDWDVHVIGRLREIPSQRPPNMVLHGEMAFEGVLTWLARADVGLAPFKAVPGVAYQTHHSNRILLYRAFGLPCLTLPELCDPGIPSLISDGAPGCYATCEGWVKTPEPLPDWTHLARRLVQKVPITPPLLTEVVPATA